MTDALEEAFIDRMLTPKVITVFGRTVELVPHSEDCPYREYSYQQPQGLYARVRYFPEWADSDDAWTVSLHYRGSEQYQGTASTLELAEAEVLKRIRDEAEYLGEFLKELK